METFEAIDGLKLNVFQSDRLIVLQKSAGLIPINDALAVTYSATGVPECTECGRLFTRMDNLRTHIKKVHRKEYPISCSICGKGFGRLVNFKGHLSMKHNMPKEYKCHMCQKEFEYKDKFKKHMLFCHKIQIAT
jgi:hypothetical protein